MTSEGRHALGEFAHDLVTKARRTGYAQFHTIDKCVLKKFDIAHALHYMHYNFCRMHKTLRVGPAMAVGVTERLWSIDDIVTILEEWENSR